MMKRMKAVESRRQTAIDEKSALLKNREYIDTLKIPSIKAKSATVLSVQNLVPYYCDNGDSNAICEPVSFTLSDGERLCLSGKTGRASNANPPFSKIYRFFNRLNGLRLQAVTYIPILLLYTAS